MDDTRPNLFTSFPYFARPAHPSVNELVAACAVTSLVLRAASAGPSSRTWLGGTFAPGSGRRRATVSRTTGG